MEKNEWRKISRKTRITETKSEEVRRQEKVGG